MWSVKLMMDLQSISIYMFVWALQCVETNFILFINDGSTNKIKNNKRYNRVMILV